MITWESTPLSAQPGRDVVMADEVPSEVETHLRPLESREAFCASGPPLSLLLISPLSVARLADGRESVLWCERWWLCRGDL